MKSIMKPGGLVILWTVLLLFGGEPLFAQGNHQVNPPGLVQSQDTTAQETYVSEVIVQAPYAKKNLVYGKEESPPGEFGYYVSEEESPAVGPSTFAVAANGDIYIADPLNNRMQRFNSQGAFVSTIPMPRTIADICVDRNNNIYLLGGGGASGGCVLKYDQKGNLLKTYPLISGFSRTGNFIYCDESGRLFYAYPWGEEEGGFYQVGTSDVVFSLAQQKNSIRKGLLGFNSVALDKNQFFTGYGSLRLMSFNGDTLKVLRSIRGEVFGCDQDLNIYAGSYSGLRKYSKSGVLIMGCKCGCERPYIEVEGRARSRTLDEKGNLYILCENEEEGLRVIKCHKQL
ncbi:MAG: hypothetical protein WCE90_09395 [Candidatus Zixiibacteriota bacterium]